jgi:hypothetical protein
MPKSSAQSETPNPVPQAPAGAQSEIARGASGLLMGAQERGLRDCYRRVSAAISAGLRPGPRSQAPGPLPQGAMPGGPADFSPSGTPALVV